MSKDTIHPITITCIAEPITTTNILQSVISFQPLPIIQCADSRSRQYQFGELHGLSTYEDCAEACVSASVQEGSIHELQGVDYNCKSRRCHCLHDEADEFVGVGPYRARGGLDNEGTGSVKNSVWANHWTCGTFSSDNAIVGGTHTYDEDESSSSARLRGSVIRSDKLFMTDEHHDMGSTDSDLPSDGSFVETELMCVAHKGVCAGSWDKSCCSGYTCQIAFPWFRCCRQGSSGVIAC